MIKVNTKTYAALREPLPRKLKGLTEQTLQNLQTELNPVPEDLIDIEYWPENHINVDYDPAISKITGETLEADSDTKQVNVTPIISPLTLAEVDAIRVGIQNANKADCTACILAAYPEPIQRSAALGVYPQATVDLISAYIAACIAEENRVFDLLEVATAATLPIIEAPVWPEVTDA